jgi:hypothetical protein
VRIGMREVAPANPVSLMKSLLFFFITNLLTLIMK